LLDASTPTTNPRSMGPTSGEERVERVAATACECDIARGGCDKRLTPVEGVSHRTSAAAAKKDLEEYTRLFDDCTDFESVDGYPLYNLFSPLVSEGYVAGNLRERRNTPFRLVKKRFEHSLGTTNGGISQELCFSKFKCLSVTKPPRSTYSMSYR